MTLRSFAAAGLAALLLAPPIGVSLPPSPSAPAALAGEHVPGEVLVKFRPEASVQRRLAAIAARGHGWVATLDRAGWTRIRTAPGQPVAEAIAAYGSDADVEWAQPNFVYRAAAVPNDPDYGLLWGLQNTGQDLSSAPTQPPGPAYSAIPGTPGADMNMVKAWDHVTDCSGVVVAVLDTGVNYTHEDLAANMWNGNTRHGWDFVDGTDDPMDANGHGTHVAGIIGAVGNNARGTTGVCWRASLMAVRVLDASGSGTSAGVVQGIDFAVANGAKVINMSLGGSGDFDRAFSDGITTAETADAAVIVAAGNGTTSGTSNDDPGNAVFPCNFTQPNLVCVAALDQAYQLASFSNFGAVSVDVGAPGTDIVSTWPGPVVGDPLTGGGWSGSSTTARAKGGWYAKNLGGTQFFVDPSAYPGAGASYNDRTDDRVYKSFDLTGAIAAFLRFHDATDVASGDHFRVACDGTGADPFAGTSPLVVLDVTRVATYPSFSLVTRDVSPCIGATCTIGFQLQSDATPQTALGVAIANFAIGTITPGATSYNTESGTSMATPAVAGLAAMLRAYNPQFTYADVVRAIEGGGRPVAALAGNTSTGKAVDAMGSLAFISPPSGLTATVQ